MTSNFPFQEFDGASITLLGGTGFVGRWLVKALHQYSLHNGFKPDITVISRNVKNAHRILTEVPELHLNIVQFDFLSHSTDLEKSDFFVNGATPTIKKTGVQNTNAVFTSSVNAANSIIRSAKKYRNTPRVVNLSSGIVYGPQEFSEKNQIERPISDLQDSQNGYRNAKIASELIFSDAARSGVIHSVSPRLFAFAGPGIVLDEHFAVGNFLRDGMKGNKIVINGNPSTVRSYMYPTDLVTWVLASLISPCNINVNIGSELPISMYDLAHLISEMTSKKGVEILGESLIASNYVPSTQEFRKNYQVKEQVALSEALARWIRWESRQNR